MGHDPALLMHKIKWVKYEKRLKYKHLRDYETEIWERFISQNPIKFELVAYDSTVGNTTFPESLDLLNYASNFKYLSSYKIDVLGHIAESITIIEIKNIAGAISIGQILLYNKLFREAHPEFKDIKLLCVCESVVPEVESLGLQLNIEFAEVGFAKPNIL